MRGTVTMAKTHAIAHAHEKQNQQFRLSTHSIEYSYRMYVFMHVCVSASIYLLWKEKIWPPPPPPRHYTHHVFCYSQSCTRSVYELYENSYRRDMMCIRQSRANCQLSLWMWFTISVSGEPFIFLVFLSFFFSLIASWYLDVNYHVFVGTNIKSMLIIIR